MQRVSAGACSSSAQLSVSARSRSTVQKSATLQHLRKRCTCLEVGGTRRIVTAWVSSASTETTEAKVADVQVDTQVHDEARRQMAERRQQRKREQMTYQFSAMAATLGVSLLAVGATYLRFAWHMQDNTELPILEMLCTLALVFGGVMGMEMWARYAHKDLWHDNAAGWALHKSHHEPRLGPFEANDLFALINGVPAMGLCLYGFTTPNILGGLCFGAGLGITLFGIMYMFVHDGLVHRRFPVGPIAELPYMKRVLVAHQLHHSDKYGGVPWGLFLGPLELEALPGGKEDLDRLVEALDNK